MTPLREERILARMLFQHQPEETQRFLQQQAASIAKALLEFKSGLNFALPEFFPCRKTVPANTARWKSRRISGGKASRGFWAGFR